MTLAALRKALALTIKDVPEGQKYATPNSPRVSVQTDDNGRDWLMLAVPLSNTSVTVSASKKSIILAGQTFRSFVHNIAGTTVVIGGSQGKVWMKPASGSDDRSFPTFGKGN